MKGEVFEVFDVFYMIPPYIEVISILEEYYEKLSEQAG
jgi:hypothetical protein